MSQAKNLDDKSVASHSCAVGNSIEQLIQAYDKYIELLGEEIDELVGIANVHGWRSSRIDAGFKARRNLEEAKVLFNTKQQ